MEDPESPMAPILVFNRFPIIPDRLERDLQVSEECITDRRTDGPTDRPGVFNSSSVRITKTFNDDDDDDASVRRPVDPLVRRF